MPSFRQEKASNSRVSGSNCCPDEKQHRTPYTFTAGEYWKTGIQLPVQMAGHLLEILGNRKGRCASKSSNCCPSSEIIQITLFIVPNERCA